ncbi:MAG: M20 family metallopeptidase [Planctomycetota bacterium]|nr:M20 family metallopeptidase [Planctomycetota bacterium]
MTPPTTTEAAAAATLDPESLRAHVARAFEDSIVPTLVDYIRIPNKSPHFDPDWAAHGHMRRAVDLIADWCRERPIAGLTVEVVELDGRTPVILMEIPGTAPGTVLLYGHLDKQPEMEGWREGLGPWVPHIEDGKLYGRGGADDGYSAFSSLCAIEALQAQGVAHARCVVLIEACEESGSFDLPAYVEHLAPRIGAPELVVCLDSGAGNYDQLWLTSSLRGNLIVNLTVEVIREGVHSGDASGVVPSSFRVARQLLDRLEDSATGRILVEALHEPIPEGRVAQARVAAEVLGDAVHARFPWHDGAGPVTEDGAELVLNRTWRPQLATTGQDGLPPLANAGNVMRPRTTLKLSLRLPPTSDPAAAGQAVKAALEAEPPYGARVTAEVVDGAPGWQAPPLAAWLEEAVDQASRTHFEGHGAVQMGEGGTIPFMGMLGAQFPEAQFLITGVLGPGSNAHGPNEFLHLEFAERLTCCVADVLARHGARS